MPVHPEPTHEGNAARRRVPAWASPLEAIGLIARGYTARTALSVSVVVGTLLSAVNEGAIMLSGSVGVATWLRLATNYVVPFLVSSVGYLAPFRRRGPPDADE
jgi:hypothetical protein